MRQNELTVAPMTAAQLAQVAALERLCFSDPWPEEILRRELQNELSLWLVAMDGDTVAGYAGSQSVIDAADLLNLAVHPSYRRRGVAQALLAALERALCARGILTLTLEVRPSNAAALALYDKLGFVQVGLRPRYYFHPTEDAMILRKDLPNEHSLH